MCKDCRCKYVGLVNACIIDPCCLTASCSKTTSQKTLILHDNVIIAAINILTNSSDKTWTQALHFVVFFFCVLILCLYNILQSSSPVFRFVIYQKQASGNHVYLAILCLSRGFYNFFRHSIFLENRNKDTLGFWKLFLNLFLNSNVTYCRFFLFNE